MFVKAVKFNFPLSQYGIKKKEEVQEPDPFANMDEGGGLNRKRKTPAELAAEAEAEDQDEFTSK